MFGQPATNTPFGAPNNNPATPFGAPAPLAFGSQAPSAFGAFGSPAAPTGGSFGFGATSTPGTVNTATSTAGSHFGSAPFGTNSAFGATPTAFGGAAPAPSSMFGGAAPAPSSMFGAAPAPSTFGAPATSVFGAPAPSAFAAPSPSPFGAPAPSAFGAPAPSIFGAPAPAPSAFGAPAPSMFGGAQSTFGGFGSTPAAPTSAFGAAPTSTFGAPAPSGGLFSSSSTSGGLFGTPLSSTNSASFGSSTGFGGFGTAPAAPAYGGFGTPAPAPAPTGSTMFGAPAPSAFGAPSIFGTPAPAPSTGGFFGAPAPAVPSGGGMFGSAPTSSSGGSKVVPFSVTTTQDGSSTSNIAFQSITAMAAYENKSFEELRFEDYSMGNKGDGSGSSNAATTTSSFGFQAPAPSAFGSTFGSSAPSSFGAPAPSAFGSTSTAPAPFGFGTPAPAPAFGFAAPSSGLFGSNTAPSSGGLFGSAPSGSNLFGSNAPAPAFGAQAPAPSSGSLFGSPSPAPGGLFGSAPAPSSGLFGAPAPSTGGLFGAPAPSTGGLFGAPAPGGLFGSSAPAPAFGAPSSGGGLFGASAPASGGLFGSTAPAPSSNFGGFGAPAPSAGGLFGSPAPAAGAFGSSFGAPTSSTPGGLFGSQNQTLVSPMATQGNIIPPAADAALQQQLAAIELQKKELEKLEVWRGKAPFNAVTVPFSLPESDILKISPYSETLTTYRASPRSTTKIYPRGFGTSSLSSNNAISPTFDSYAASPMHTPAKIAASSAKRLVIRPDAHTPKPVIRLRLTNADMTLSPANDSSQEEVQEPELPSPKVLDLKEVEPKKSEEKAETPKVDTAFDIYNQVVGMSPRKSPKAIAKYVPTLSMSGYLTTPSLAEMETKSEAELAALSGFSITREGFGSVAWDGTVDVRGINLDSIISISHQDVAVYDNQEVDGTKPAIGEKLNRPAVISLYNTFPKKGGKNASEDAKQKFSKKLEKATAQMNADFISYDSVNGTWKFRVQHFSRYGLFDDDSDDEDDMEVVEKPKVTPSVLPTVPEVSTMQSNLHSGEQRERSLVMNENTTPTRFRVPQEEDDETDVEMADDDLPLIPDVGVELKNIEDAGIEAYKSMFLSPATVHDTRKQMDMEEPEDDDVFEEEVPLLFTPPLLRFDPPRERDMAVCRGPSICSKLMEEEGLSRSSIDMSIRMARSFRVAWRPDGSFLSLASRTVLVQKRPQFSQTRKKSHNLPVLDIFMKYAKVNQNSGFSWEELSRKSVSAAIQDYIRVIPSVGNTPEYLLNQSLSLILCLLQACDEPTTFHLQRSDVAIEATPYNPESRATDAFCKWLNSVCRKQGKAEIDSAKKRGDIYGAIWIALISGDISMASAIATENGHFQLAALIASGPGSSSLIHEQVRQWRETGASRTISPHLMRIYTLLGGDFQQEKEFFQKGDTSCNWMNRIRLYLTYGVKKGSDIYDLSTIFSKYEGEIAAGTAPNPIPPFMKPGRHNSEPKSVVYKIMQLSKFVSEGISSQMSLAEVILPQQHTHSEHDVEGSFLLAIVLSKLGCCSPLTELEQARLLSCYTTQLISRGEWESAVNATLTQLGPTRLHEWRYKLAKDIILRHYSFESSKRKKYFTEKLKLPNSWLEEALADRAVNRNDILSYVKHVKEFSRHEAQAALEEVLVPSLLFQQPSIAQDSLNLMKTLLPSRHSLASSVVDFFDLSQAIKEISMRPLSEQSSRISQLIVKADEVEADLYQYKLKSDNLVRPSVSRIAPVEVPMSCFLVESLSGITFLKLQLRALESGSSIWDDKSGSSVMPMKSSSQLVANSEVVTKSRALKGYF